jgi:hypothetical protein
VAWSVAKQNLLDKIKRDTPPAIAEQIRRQADARALIDTFGEGFKRDKHGKPMEQGRGSPGNQTRESVDSYERWKKDEPGYEENLARMKRELAVCEERRRKEREAQGIVED